MIVLNAQKILYGSQGKMKFNVNLNIKKGEFIALMGESGSGKTTLLRILAGLEKYEGNISVDDLSWDNLSVQNRDIGFVFQDYALFEHMTVEENLLFVAKDSVLASELLEMTELSTLSSRNVKGLSGGQKQRVALCRALMNKPKLLLMDEPFSALDRKMKLKLQDKVLKLHSKLGITTIMVSHDTDVSYTLAQRIVVLEHGKVIIDGNTNDVLHKQETTTYSLRD